MQPTDEAIARYIQFGLSRDKLNREVSKQAGDCFHAARQPDDPYQAIDQVVERLSLQEVPGKLPVGRPLTLLDLFRAGALSTRLANILLNEDLMTKKLGDIGAAHYKHLDAAPYAGPKSILELMAIVEIHRQSKGFTSGNGSQPERPEEQVARAAQSWQRLTGEEQERAIGRLVKCLADPRFAAAIMGPMLPLIEAQLESPPYPRPPRLKEPGVT